MTALTLNLDSIAHLTHAQFRELCRDNRDVRLELTAEGELIVMPPTGWESGRRNANLTMDLGLWNRQVGLGIVFDSSTGFILPNGAVRSPDAAWVAKERITALNPNPDGFLPLAPDFVIELQSASDRLKTVQHKMQEYIDNGVRLGFLLNPQDRIVEIYRPGREVEVLLSPAEILGEDVLPGFVLNLKGIFED
ncbi:Uma2 family endonuclease [Altericista sp. CCNU0014]|uniref:Uma2 family endonuclease n=1 Tax=Altericista sp. CCNU0014 TaxID=3082949 RepID=UPI0038517CFE